MTSQDLMKNVIHSAEDHTPALILMGVGQHNFEKCPVAEKSDVDAAANAAEKNAKDFAGGLAGQLREELARARAEFRKWGETQVTRVNQLVEAKPDLNKLQELACRVQELEERLELAQKGSLKNIRDDLEALQKRVAEVIERLPGPISTAERGPMPPTDGNHYEDLEIGLRKVELNLREFVERVTQLEQMPAPHHTERLLGQVQTLMAERDSRALYSSSFLQRLHWLFRGPHAPMVERRQDA